MKKAFTMIELVFVLVVVGIITAMIAPNFQGNNLREAADQLISHIRYTQHLAMMDDKYDPSESNWYRKRWEIRFVKNITNGSFNCNGEDYHNIWSYMIYTNKSFSCPGGICDNNPNNDEIAKNPINNNELLSGGYNNYLCPENSYNASNEQSADTMRLKEKYGIQNVIFSGGCRSTTRFVSFDYLGRPFNSFPRHAQYAFSTTGYPRLITNTCKITLCNDANCLDKNVIIAIEPETGYAHIL